MRILIIVSAEHRDKSLLRNVDATELLHLRLALFLFLKQLLLTCHVAAVELRGDIFSVGLNRRSCDDRSADYALDGNLELVARNRFGELFAVMQRRALAFER